MHEGKLISLRLSRMHLGSNMANKNILKYPGSKWNTAEWIVNHFPAGYEKMNYFEPYFGSGAVFFTKNRSQIETVNDIDDDVVNLFQVARDFPEQLARAIYFTPWARAEYRKSYDREDSDAVEQARRFLVRMWQAIGAKSYCSTGWRKNAKRATGNVCSFTISLPENIIAVAERLKPAAGNKIVQIENKPALELIKRHNTSNTLIYADPPYVLSSRKNKKIYKFEMSDEDHHELITALINHKGPVVISNYDNDLYNGLLSGWFRAEKHVQAESGTFRNEIIWCNFEPDIQQKLFGEGSA